MRPRCPSPAARTRHGALAIAAVAVLSLALAAGSAQAKIPVAYIDTTETGVASADGADHYYAHSRQGHTRVMRFTPEAQGKTLKIETLQGIYQVPAVAFDGTTAGLSQDGDTLLLTEPRLLSRRASTRMLLLDTERLRKRASIELRGDYSLDAISPDGSLLYLIHYLGTAGSDGYEVRVWDVERERLLREPVLDSETAPIVMRGLPVTRAVSPDGIWTYTLYTGGDAPFVHALDTVAGTSVCVDVDPAAGTRRPERLRLELAPDGSELGVLDRDRRRLATIATGSWEVSAPADQSEAASAGGGLPSWPALAAIAAGLGLVGLAVARRRDRPSA